MSSFAEDLDKAVFTPADYCRETALVKCASVARALLVAGGRLPDLVIGADTVVEDAQGRILEKPRDAAHAAEMLRGLSGATHRVHTGCALILPRATEGGAGPGPAPPALGLPAPTLVRSFSVTTEVDISVLSEADIEAYVATGEPFDKAGSYGIQARIYT